MKIRELFNEPTDKPISDTEKKWYSIGIYGTLTVLLIIGMPLLFGISTIKQYVLNQSSQTVFLLVFVIPFCIFIYWKAKTIDHLAHNIALVFYDSDKRKEERKAKKLLEKT